MLPTQAFFTLTSEKKKQQKQKLKLRRVDAKTQKLLLVSSKCREQHFNLNSWFEQDYFSWAICVWVDKDIKLKRTALDLKVTSTISGLEKKKETEDAILNSILLQHSVL